MSKTPQLSKVHLDAIAEEFYLVYFNDYLSTEKMADHYGISDELAYELMNHGKNINNARPTKKDK